MLLKVMLILICRLRSKIVTRDIFVKKFCFDDNYFIFIIQLYV